MTTRRIAAYLCIIAALCAAFAWHCDFLNSEIAAFLGLSPLTVTAPLWALVLPAFIVILAFAVGTMTVDYVLQSQYDKASRRRLELFNANIELRAENERLKAENNELEVRANAAISRRNVAQLSLQQYKRGV